MRTKVRLDSDRHLITFNEGSRGLKDSCQQEERGGMTGHYALFGEAGQRKSGMDLTRLLRPSCPCVPRIDHAARVAKRAVLLRDGFLPSEGASPESGFRRRRRIPGAASQKKEETDTTCTFSPTIIKVVLMDGPLPSLTVSFLHGLESVFYQVLSPTGMKRSEEGNFSTYRPEKQRLSTLHLTTSLR